MVMMRSATIIAVVVVLTTIAAGITVASAAPSPSPPLPHQYSGCWQFSGIRGNVYTWTNQLHLFIQGTEWPISNTTSFTGTWIQIKGGVIGQSGMIDNGTLTIGGDMRFAVRSPTNNGDAFDEVVGARLGGSLFGGRYCINPAGVREQKCGLGPTAHWAEMLGAQRCDTRGESVMNTNEVRSMMEDITGHTIQGGRAGATAATPRAMGPASGGMLLRRRMDIINKREHHQQPQPQPH